MKYVTYALVLLLGACSTMQGAYNTTIDTIDSATDGDKNIVEYHKCPSVFVVEDLSFMQDYAHNVQRVPENLKSFVEMQNASDSCSYEAETVIVDMKLDFEGRLGPKGRLVASDAPLYSYPFFVAITDRSGKVMAKQIFAATMPYSSGNDTGTYSETIRQIIPIPSESKAKNYAVMAGFQISEAQLTENRDYLTAQRKAAEQAAREARAKALAAAKAAEVNTSTPNENETIKPAENTQPAGATEKQSNINAKPLIMAPERKPAFKR